MLITVKIRQSDIIWGRSQRKKSVFLDPLSRAMGNATKERWGVSRGGGYSKKFGHINWPPDVVRWLDKYDAHEDVNPLTFEIKLVPLQ